MILRVTLAIIFCFLVLSCSKNKKIVYEPSAKVDAFAIYEEALEAFELVTKLEEISPSLEPAHAFAEAIKIAPKLDDSNVIVIDSCGDSIKDKDIIKKRLGSYSR